MITNLRSDSSKTPAARTKILKGAGGGSTAGTARARTSKRSKVSRARFVFSAPKRFTSNVSSPRRPIQYRTRQPASDPKVALKSLLA